MSDMNTGAAAPQDEREAFEAWFCQGAQRQGVEIYTVAQHRLGNGYGTQSHLDGQWIGWQARAAQHVSAAYQFDRAALPAQAVAPDLVAAAHDAYALLSELTGIPDARYRVVTALAAALEAPVRDVAPSARELDMAMLIRRVVVSARRNCEDGSNVLKLANGAADYLRRSGLDGSPLRDSGIESDPAVAKDVAPSDAPVWGASTLADLNASMEGAHELSGAPHERIDQLIDQRNQARAESAERGAVLKRVRQEYADAQPGVAPKLADAQDAARYRFAEQYGWPEYLRQIRPTEETPTWGYGESPRFASPREAIDAARPQEGAAS